MNKAIEVIVAQGILKVLGSEEVIYSLKNGKIVEEELIDNFKLLTEAIDNGLPLILPVRHKDTISSFLDHLLYEDNSKKMIDYICSKLTKEDVSNLSVEMVNDIYKSSDNNIDLLEKFFSLGFDFQQGTFEEYEKTISADIRFFELCLNIKPDFKFSFQYEDTLTLDELLLEEIADCKSYDHSPDSMKNKESLYAFLKKARQSEEWREELKNNLSNNDQPYMPTRKI